MVSGVMENTEVCVRADEYITQSNLTQIPGSLTIEKRIRRENRSKHGKLYLFKRRVTVEEELACQNDKQDFLMVNPLYQAQ
ncbi:hypothetical protein SK128_004640 [Halocaridina rubra]|uniref:Uncharacterized protein n=1 Tax=Halocaridina rubra TaxID=373956 RepID=A0AAN9AGB1_HALRR